MRLLLSLAFILLAALASVVPAAAESRTGSRLGKGFVSATAIVSGAKLHYVRGGEGPALILVHGFPQDWHEFRAVMPRLAKRFTVIAVDLRGIGRSVATSGGFSAATMAGDIHDLISKLRLDRVFLVGHDIGGIVAYAYLRKYPGTLRGAMILDVPLPGIDGWTEVMDSPMAWHAHFMQVPGLAEKLVAGRTADFLGYFFAMGRFAPEEIANYVKAYEAPAQLRAAFGMYRAFPAAEKSNAGERGRNDVPLVFAAGGESPFAKLAPKIAQGLRMAGMTHVETELIPGAGHYIFTDRPRAAAELIERHGLRR
ncbi:MAG: alpha/beta fold hydrolase [Parvibaculaceae bacterium]